MENLSQESSDALPAERNRPTILEQGNPISYAPIFLNNFAYKSIIFQPKITENISFFPEKCFYLIYNLEGNVLSFVDKTNYVIGPMESFLIYDQSRKGICLRNVSNKSSTCFICAYSQGDLQNNSMMKRYRKFRELFFKLVEDKSLTVKRNLQTYEKISSLSHLPHKQIADDFIIEGILFQIFGIEINQILEDSISTINNFSLFNSKEMEQLQSVSEEIAKNPQKEYSIDFLCRTTGMGPNKLQRGFKRMHNQTVINYIRHMRLLRSIELMRTTDLTISEIVYSIGLSSRSYFSKIFKSYYKCLPKDFQKRQKV